MAYIKANLITEARRLANGKRTRIPPEVIGQWAVDNVAQTETPKGDSVRWLEALYRLEDPRGQPHPW